MRERPFLERTNDRRLPADYTGTLLIWDIDKTYLDTRFTSWRGLAAIPFELALDKEAIAGAVPLIRALRRGAGERRELVPLYFVSGSPPQLRRVIERKMTLDGVDFDGITFKDQLGLLLAGRPRSVKQQIGYKLQALLQYRKETPPGARWLLFGDDIESDAEVFLLFGEVCGGLRGEALDQRLSVRGVHPTDRERIALLASELGKQSDPVEGVFIHRTSGRPPGRPEDRRVIEVVSFLQAALVLAATGRIRPEAIGAVARELRTRHIPESALEAQLADARERLAVSDTWVSLARQ